MAKTEKYNNLWKNPPAIFRPAPFWSWNSQLDPDRLVRQAGSMSAAGFGGFFMHSRYGLKTEYLGPKWFECISACVEAARNLGIKAYLYDEDRWPSGSAGGNITRDEKRYRMRYLVAGDPAELAEMLDNASDRLGLFKVVLNKQGNLESFEPAQEAAEGVIAIDVRLQRCRPWENDGTYIDTMNAEAVDRFLEVTHEAYRKGFGDDFGGVIPAIFTDEANYGLATLSWFPGDIEQKYTVQWTRDLSEEFRKRRGYTILPHLPELVFPRSEGSFSEVVYDYYLTIAELFTERFTSRVGKWCTRNKIALTGHVLYEENLKTQVCAVGACMPHYEFMDWPGIDVLCDKKPELITAKQCSSVADQLGKERVLSELYGCTGWDWPLEGHKYTSDWHFALGVNFLCPHLSHYSLAGAGKRDYPASILDHAPWWKYYRRVNDYLARTAVMLTAGEPVRDVLVIHPIESQWGIFNYTREKYTGVYGVGQTQGHLDSQLAAVVNCLTRAHYDWDFGDESLLAKHASVDGGEFVVGRMRYRLVLVPPLFTLRASTVDLLEKFMAAGGKVLFVDSTPERIDGRLNERVTALFDLALRCAVERGSLVKAVESAVDRRVSVTENGSEQGLVWAMLRRIEGGMLLFLQSHDRQKNHKVQVRVEGPTNGAIVAWDALTGDRTLLKGRCANGYTRFELNLAPSGSAIITLGLDVPEAMEPLPELPVSRSLKINGPFDITLTEPNSIPLDYCRYRLGEGDFSRPMPSLKVDTILRRRFGIPTRYGGEQQPWYLAKIQSADVPSFGHLELLYQFHVTEIPPSCRLVVERPENFKISFNGRPIGQPDAFWVDEDLKSIDVAGLLQAGLNNVLLACELCADTALEDLYLIGDFGATRLDPARPFEPGNVTVTAAHRSIETGSWVGQGLAFYGGAVRYNLTVEKPQSPRRLRLRLPSVNCTAAAIHAGGRTFFLPWAPFEADITDSLREGANNVVVEVIGGRKNILGPLHVPQEERTGPDQFSPDNPNWTFEYLLNDHGLMEAIVVEILG